MLDFSLSDHEATATFCSSMVLLVNFFPECSVAFELLPIGVGA